VVALPVLVLLFVGAGYVRDLTVATHEARTTARTCAWLYSANNCRATDAEGNSLGFPAECLPILSRDGVFGDGAAGANDDLDDAKSQLHRTGSGVGDFIQTILEPVLDGVFGEAGTAKATRSVQRPTIFGGSTVAVAGNYRIACNVSETTLDSVAKQAWGAITNLFR